jgi:DNA repair protein RecO (recombination protein O)
MSLIKEKGIVVSTKLVGEADALITLLGESGSKAKYRLKGIKKSKNRPIIASELGSFISIDYYHHKNTEIHNVKEVSIIDRFENPKSTYEGYLLIIYFCELIDSILPNGDSHTKCFELFYAALQALNTNKFHPLILPFFKLRLLSLLGLVSKDFSCAVCEEPVLVKNSAALHYMNLEITCGDCHPPLKNQILSIRLMDKIFKMRYANLSGEEIPTPVIIELDQILNDYLRSYLNVALKAFDLLYKSMGTNYEIHY